MKLHSLFTGASFITTSLIAFFVLLIFSPTLIFPAKVSSDTNSLVSVFSTGYLKNNTLKKNIPGIPVRLKIPTINVDAFLERVRLTPSGIVDVPKGGVNAAWYELGPRPGRIGSAVIVGHYGTRKNGQGSVFDRLQELRTGDKVSVEDDKGVIISFTVTKIKTYSPNAIVPEVFTSKDGKSHLNLITCDGAWNKKTKHYPNRLVIFTDRE